MQQRYEFKIPNPIGINLVGEVLKQCSDSKRYIFQSDVLKGVYVECENDQGPFLYDGNTKNIVCMVVIEDLGEDNLFVVRRLIKDENV